MPRILIGLAMLVLVAAAAEAQMTDGWQSGGTGRGSARWELSERQVVYRGGADFGWAVKGDPIADGFVEVRFRPVEGRRDQAGGVVWRWQDANNYYIARANALENNVVAYRMVNGTRTDLRKRRVTDSDTPSVHQNSRFFISLKIRSASLP